MRDLGRWLLCLGLYFAFCAGSLAYGQAEFLDQNWSPEVRQAYYTTSQGSRMMLYDWFVALETSEAQDSFARDRLVSLGYLPNENEVGNSDKLPVGFVLDKNELSGERFVGLTCAACHTNQIEYEGRTFQIDGGPALADMFGMLSGIEDSVTATLADGDKFDRFSDKVLGESPGLLSKAKLKRSLRKFLVDWSQLVKNSRSEHPWGRARLDAFGMIFNRVSSIDLGIPANSQIPDAPVSYPFLWGTSFQDRVQWNGAVPNGNDIERLGRNVGEVLGVFGQAEFRASELFEIPRPARTSAKRLNQVKLENHLKKLWSPKWPEHFGELDAVKVAAGKKLYKTNCLSCHQVVPHGQQNTPVAVSMTPLSEVLTDPKMAMNAALTTASTGNLKRLFRGRTRVPRDEMLQRLVRLAVISPYRDVPKGGLLDQLGTDDVFSPEEIALFLREVGFNKSQALELVEANQDKLKSYYKGLRKTIRSMKGRETPMTSAAEAPPILKYKAAPLAGIWATAPYLHNGSVPNLYELLLPASERSPTFSVGSKKFDPERVGFETTATEGMTVFDTTKPGNLNTGHDMYGTFTDEERWALVEYLKSL